MAPGQVARPGAGDRPVRRQACAPRGARRPAAPPRRRAAPVGQPIARNARARPDRRGLVLVLGAFGLIFIGLVSVAGFTVMAQRRLRALGMLAAVGATDRDLRLVMIASGAAAGVAGALAGAALGLRRLACLRAAAAGQCRARHRPAAAALAAGRHRDGAGGGHRRGRRLAASPRGRPGPGRGGHVRAPGPARRRPPPRRRPPARCSPRAWACWPPRADGRSSASTAEPWAGARPPPTAGWTRCCSSAAWWPPSSAPCCSPHWSSRCPRPWPPRRRPRSGSQCVTWAATGPGPEPRWPRSPSPSSPPCSPAS